MSIETGGYQVGVMPQYTPMDPRMVAFQPQQFSAGALSSLELINELDKRKAFAAQQAEQAATRAGRVGAMNAQNLATMDLAPRKSLADIALADQAAALAPGATTVGLGAQVAALRNQGNATQLDPYLQDTALTKAMSDSSLAGKRADLDAANVDAQTEIQPVKAEFDLEKAREALGSITEDKNLSDQEKVAKIRQLNASAAASEANASYTDRNKPKAGRQNTIDEAQKQLGHIEMSIRRLESQKVVDPNSDTQGMPVPIQQYQASTRDAKGNVVILPKTFPYIFQDDKKAVLNPEAEKVSAQLNQLYALRESYNNQIAQALQEDATPDAAPIDVTRGLAGLMPATPGAAPVQAAPIQQAPVAPPPVQRAAIPLTPAQAATLKPGTVFLGTDGKQHVRK